MSKSKSWINITSQEYIDRMLDDKVRKAILIQLRKKAIHPRKDVFSKPRIEKEMSDLCLEKGIVDRPLGRNFLTPHICKINLSFLLGSLFHENCIKNINAKDIFKRYLEFVLPNFEFKGDDEYINRKINQMLFPMEPDGNLTHFMKDIFFNPLDDLLPTEKQKIQNLKSSIMISETKTKNNVTYYRLNEKYFNIIGRFWKNWPSFRKNLDPYMETTENTIPDIIMKEPPAESQFNTNYLFLYYDSEDGAEKMMYWITPRNTETDPIIISRIEHSYNTIIINDQSISTTQGIKIYMEEKQTNEKQKINLMNVKGIVYINNKQVKEGEKANIKHRDIISIGKKDKLLRVCNFTDYENLKKINRKKIQCPYCINV